MIHRHDHSIGITLFKWNRTKVELWISSAMFPIQRHSHKCFKGNIVLLKASHIFCRLNKGTNKEQSTTQVLKLHSIPLGWIHWAECIKGKWFPSVFIDIQQWETKPTSACTDFIKA